MIDLVFPGSAPARDGQTEIIGARRGLNDPLCAVYYDHGRFFHVDDGLCAGRHGGRLLAGSRATGQPRISTPLASARQSDCGRGRRAGQLQGFSIGFPPEDDPMSLRKIGF